MRQNTPCGLSDDSGEVRADGVIFYSAPSHGGFWLSPERNKQVPIEYRRATFNGQGLRGWYEEDCDWCIVALHFRDLFTPEELRAAEETHAHWIAPKAGGARKESGNDSRPYSGRDAHAVARLN